MVRRLGELGLILAFLFFAFNPLSAECAEKGKSSKGSTPAPAAHPASRKATLASAPELNAAIERIFVKGNRVFIALARSGSGRIAPEDYSRIMLRLQTSKGLRQWNLAEVDRTRALVIGTGRVEFDTGIVLEKGETVKGVLSMGKIEKPRQEMLMIRSASISKQDAPYAMVMSGGVAKAQQQGSATTPMKTAMASAIGRRSGSHTPTPLNLDDSGGIHIVERAAVTSHPGDRFQIQFWMTRPVAAGMVDLQLRKMGGGDHVYQTVSIGWNPAGEPSVVTGMTLPATGLTSGTYYISGTHSEAWGISDSFVVEVPGEGVINIGRPRAGEGVTPGFDMTVEYMLTRHVSEGVIRFELYKIYNDGSYGAPVLNMTRSYRPGPAGTPEPGHIFQMRLPRDLAAGQYFVMASHPEATGRSATFEVAWEREGHDFPSDYAVVDIFKRGDDFKASIRATGGDMADRVELSVNGEIRREIIRPAADTDITIRRVDYGRESCGVFHEVTVDPNRHLSDNRENNTLRKFVPIEDPDGYAESQKTLDSRGRWLLPCENLPGSTGLGSIAVLVRNCSSEPVTISASAVQVGWTNIYDPATYFTESKPVYYFIDWTGIREPEPVPPGSTLRVSVQVRDMRQEDSSLSFSFSGSGLTRWRHLTNPFIIPVRFGRVGTVIDTRNGAVRHTCDYVNW